MFTKKFYSHDLKFVLIFKWFLDLLSNFISFKLFFDF